MALLLKKGADIKAKDSKDRDAWDLVLARGGGRFLLQKQAQALSLLIEHGMKPRMTLIQCAMNADSNVLVESLVKAGADLSATDKFGWTALHHAAIAGNADTCEALLKAGANPNAESTADFTERDNSDEFDSHVTYKFRYQAGSRPLDVVKDRATRGSRSARKVLTDAGATKNPKVKNKIRY
jgi:ankyrin repeat protein